MLHYHSGVNRPYKSAFKVRVLPHTSIHPTQPLTYIIAMMAGSEFILQQSIAGTDALDVANLYNIKGRVAVGESRPATVGNPKCHFHFHFFPRNPRTPLTPPAVTGGGTGLGLITAMALAQNGVRVYITGRRLEPLQAAETFTPHNGGTGKIVAVQGDLSSKEGIIGKLKAQTESQATERRHRQWPTGCIHTCKHACMS